MSQDCPCELPPLVHPRIKACLLIASLATSSVTLVSIYTIHCTYAGPAPAGLPSSLHSLLGQPRVLPWPRQSSCHQAMLSSSRRVLVFTFCGTDPSSTSGVSCRLCRHTMSTIAIIESSVLILLVLYCGHDQNVHARLYYDPSLHAPLLHP